MLIRSLRIDDDLGDITEMLHRAYAALGARGLRYNATHQSPEVTARRLVRGYPILAENDGRIVGTLTVYRPDPNHTAMVYRDAETYHFGQFGVDPEFRGRGLGRALHSKAIDYAGGQGARFMALDTAAPATELIALYERWGYRICERISWDSTNYESVLMRRKIDNVRGRSSSPTLASFAPRSAQEPRLS
jgi:GNAT superfamily N-acetyltransferase